jgi:hypothetical protein
MHISAQQHGIGIRAISQNLNTRISGVLRIGLALITSASLSLAYATDAALLTLAASAQSRADFSGHWVLNTGLSDNPQEKAKEAMQAMKQSRSGGRGMGGAAAGKGGGMGGGRQGRGAREGVAGRSETPSREMFALIATAERLDITHQEPLLLIADENDQQQRLYTDFRGASVSASGGVQQRTSIAGWEGVVLVVETTMIGGAKLIQHYQVDVKTGQLMIMTAASLAEGQALAYRLVYDQLPPGADAASR